MSKNLPMLSAATLTLTLIALTVPATASQADDSNSSYLSLGTGYYGQINDGDGSSTDFRLEYRDGNNLWIKLNNLKPWLGAELSSDAALWVGGGLLYNAKLSPTWSFIPSIGAGLYNNGNSEVDLDRWLQLRSQLELAYTLPSKNRIGLYLSHTSNAGLGNKNPGIEGLGLYWHIAQ